MLPRERIEIVTGDITAQHVDAVVNAANKSLLGGGGVDGAIHRAAGPDLLEACKTLSGCDTGACKLTEGYNLPARYVIHCVGPVWRGGDENEDQLLAGCYGSAIRIARNQYLKSIAFPVISAGAYGFPLQRASRIALETVRAEGDESFDFIRFVCFDDKTSGVFRSVSAQLAG